MPLLEILRTKAVPIINMKEIEHKIAKSILKISPICSNSPVIFESAIGSVIVARNLYVIQSIANLKIGAITFTFSNNMVIRNRYGKKIRRWVEKFFKEAHIYTGGCREAIFNGNEYELVPIS